MMYEYYVDWRLRGDDYNEHFGNGLTLSMGESVQDMEIVSREPDKTVFRGKKGHTLTCFHEKKGDVTECRTLFENTTSETAVLELFSSFAIKGITADHICRATSFWSAEGKLLRQKLTDINMERSWANHGIRVEKFGQIGTMPVRKWFPFLVLEDSGTGHFLGVQLYCASSWQIEVLRRDESIYIQGGIADRDYGSWTKEIPAGGSFSAPKAVVAEGSSLYEVCDKLVKAQKSGMVETDKDLPVIFNEWCTTWGDPSYDKLEKIANRIEGSGIRYLVIDAGWYKRNEEEDWFRAIGDWRPSPILFPDGIKAAADMIRSHGLIPGLWCEFENVGTLADAFNETEHLQKRDGFPVTVGSRRFWDLRDPWVWEYLDEKVLRLLKDNGFGYVKVDYNENIGAGVDGAESYGEGLRQSVEESRRYFRHLHEEMPELVIENCSSGGHRLEPSMMELVSQASFSDAHECTSIPIIAANLQLLIRPEQSQIWAVLREKDDVHRLNYTLAAGFLGRLCISGDVVELSDEQWARAREAIDFYGKIKHIIRDGCTTMIDAAPGDYNIPQGYQVVVRSLGKQQLVVVHTFENGANPPIDKYLEGRKVVARFGSDLDGDFRGCAYLLEESK
jgi:alpha-galactosidase